MRLQRNPRAMRNLPLVAFRLTDDQRTAADAVAARRGLTLNALARDALLDMVARDETHVNASAAATREATGARDLTYVPDEQG